MRMLILVILVFSWLPSKAIDTYGGKTCKEWNDESRKLQDVAFATYQKGDSVRASLLFQASNFSLYSWIKCTGGHPSEDLIKPPDYEKQLLYSQINFLQTQNIINMSIRH